MTADALEFSERRQPAYIRSFALAAAVHIGLAAIMMVAVHFRMSPPESVVVELWEPPSPPPPQPAVEAPKPPPPVKVEPPKVEKPEIVEKVEPPKPKPKAEPPKPKPRPDDFKKRLREQLALEQKAMDRARQEREAKDKVAREQAALRAKALSEYIGRIQAKVKSNWILPQELQGNPEAVFSVVQLPNGEIIGVKLLRSSGLAAYDTAVERAILKSSPLPLPANRQDFSRELKLTFRPRD